MEVKTNDGVGVESEEEGQLESEEEVQLDNKDETHMDHLNGDEDVDDDSDEQYRA